MKFLNPSGLWLLLGLPVLLLIYLIKARHEDLPVSSTYIWRLSSRFMKKRLPLQRLKKILAFLMQLLILLALAFLAARPAVIHGEACDYILILDASASMENRNEDGLTRFERAAAGAEEMADVISEGHTVSVILASDNPVCLVRESTSLNEVKAALENAECSLGGCNTEEALSMAQEICDQSSNCQVLFYTDREYTANNLEVVDLSEDEWNVSLLSLTETTSDSGSIFTGKLVSHHREASVTVGLRIDGTIVDAQFVDCGQDTETEVVFTEEKLASYDTAELFIEEEDALAEDNSFALCRKTGRTYGVLLVSASPFYLESALSALGSCDVDVVSSLGDADLTGYDLYIFDGILPETYPEDASCIVFGTEALPEGVTAGQTTAAESPLTAGTGEEAGEICEDLSLKEAVVSNVTALTADASWSSLFYCGDSAVAVTKETENGTHRTVFSFDLHDSNLPMESDFVILMRNLVTYSVPELLKKREYAVGDTVRLTSVSEEAGLYVESPDGSVKALPASDSHASFTVRDVGIYTAVLEADEGSEYADFFVHIPLDESGETDGGTLTIDRSGQEGAEVKDAASEVRFWITLGALIVVLMEWWWYYREQC